MKNILWVLLVGFYFLMPTVIATADNTVTITEDGTVWFNKDKTIGQVEAEAWDKIDYQEINSRLIDSIYIYAYTQTSINDMRIATLSDDVRKTVNAMSRKPQNA